MVAVWCRRFVASMLVAVLWISGASPGNAQSGPPSEYEVKAAFLLNFTKFVTWPNLPASETAQQFTVCVAGQDPFGSLLDDAFEERTVEDRPVVIQRRPHDASALGCQMLFVGESREARVRELLERLGRQGVLTIGEGEEFARLGGMISLTLKEKRIHLSINQKEADRARLKLSSQLLNLATIVESN